MAARGGLFTRWAERIGLGRSPIWDGCGVRCGRQRDERPRCPGGYRPCGDGCRPAAACCPGETLDLLVVPAGGTEIASRAVLAAGGSFEVRAEGLVPAGGGSNRRCDAAACFDAADPRRWTDRCGDGSPLGLRLAGVAVTGGWERSGDGHEYRAVVVGTGRPLRLAYRRCGDATGGGHLAVSLRCADPAPSTAEATTA